MSGTDLIDAVYTVKRQAQRVRELTKTDNAAAMVLREIIKEQVATLETQLGEVERALGRPKINANELKLLINSAMITIAEMKSFCP